MRRRVRARQSVSGLLTGVLLAAAAAIISPSIAAADETTVSVDNLRTGWDQNEAGLGPSAVSASDFGQLFATNVNGQVYAQPIVIGGTLIAMTDNNWIYEMNPATGAITWSRSVGPAWPASAIGCGDLVPNIGITSTPVYDPATGAVFFMAKVNDGSDADHPHFYMHAIIWQSGGGLVSDGPVGSSWPPATASRPRLARAPARPARWPSRLSGCRSTATDR